MPAAPAADLERGSAVVDFALVGALVTLLFVAVVQVALVVHVRTTLVDCAAEGARWGARAGRTPDDAAARARDLVGAELSRSYAARLRDGVRSRRVDRAGVRVVEVTIRAPLPLVALLGPAGALTVSGHAFDESQ